MGRRSGAEGRGGAGAGLTAAPPSAPAAPPDRGGAQGSSPRAPPPAGLTPPLSPSAFGLSWGGRFRGSRPPQFHLVFWRRPLPGAGSPRHSGARTGARPPPRPAPAPQPSPAVGEGGHTCGWRSLLDTVLPDRRGPGSGRAQGAGLGRERSAREREGRHHGENFTTVWGHPPRECRWAVGEGRG